MASNRKLQPASEDETIRLRRELSEARDRQAATSEILNVIHSSHRSVQPVFDAIVHAGLKLFPDATIGIALQDGAMMQVAAIAGPDPAGVEAWRKRFPAPLHPETIHGFVILNGKVVDLPDVESVQDQYRVGAGNFLASGYRAVTMLPISHRGASVGALSVLRLEAGSLTDEQLSLLQTFTAQANIAIENTQRVNDMRETNEVLEHVSSQLAKYIPPQLYQSIMAGEKRATIESRRKKLTIFFSDIVDFAEITDQLEAEELTSLLNEYLTEMSKIAQSHGAYFDKFIGDAMMFYFGDPETRGVKEDAAACVRMAMAMQQRLAELQVGWHRKGLIDRPFQARIGINTGYCTVGNFGSDSRMDYTIIGSEVNLAARLEAKAEAGGILLAAETYSLVEDWLAVDERDPVVMKGFAKPVRTFAVTGIQEQAAKSESLIREQADGYSLSIDMNRLDDDSRVSAIRALKQALSQLEK